MDFDKPIAASESLMRVAELVATGLFSGLVATLWVVSRG